MLKDAVEAISSLPGVGSRSALRLALHLLKQPRDQVHHFCDAISALSDDVKYCKVCNMISDSELCSICSDGRRDASTICVVESVRDVMSIEATGQYRGLYHVLGGIISPINGVAPSDLAIPQLLDRLRDSSAADSLSEGPEVILALSGDVEGETTAFYLYRQIDSLSRSLNLNVRVSTLARGLGFGDDLEYADTLTLGRSIAARQPFKP